MTDFDAFAADAAELFGLDENEAADLLATMEDVFGFDDATDTLHAYAIEATDVLDAVVDFDAIELAEDEELEDEDGGDHDDGVASWYDLDPDWEGDNWLDADTWFELSAYYMED